MDIKERENFNRNSTLIVEHTKEGFSELIEFNVTLGGYNSFEKFINDKQHDIYHLCYNRSRCCQCPSGFVLPRSRILHPSQLEILLNKNGPKKTCHNPGRTADFCCCFAHPGLTTNVLDVTLARCLLVNFCQDVFWYSCLTAQTLTLEEFLTRNKHHIYHLHHINRRCCQCPPSYAFPTQIQLITKAQWNKLFSKPCLPCQLDRKRPVGGPQTICASSVIPGIAVSSLGSDLSQVLIDHCCPLKQSIEKLVEIRNDTFGHAKEARIPENEYVKYRYKIESNLVFIGQICNKHSTVQQKLKDLDRRTLDSVLLMQTIREQLNTVEVMSTQMSKVSADITSVITQHATEIITKLGQHFDKKMEEFGQDQARRQVEEVRLKVAEIETNISEVIPVHIQDQITKQLEVWREKDQKIVSTRGSDHVLESIKENNCITVTGNPGIGKTFIVRHVALIMQSEGYTIIPTCIPKDIRDFTKPGGRTLFIIDDIGGHYTLNQTYLEDWNRMLSDIELLLTNNHCKIIATCRSQVFKDEKFKTLSMFKLNECNLSSEKLCLTSKENSQIAKKYFGGQAYKISQLSDQYEFFPLLCSLYDKDKFSDISLFLSQPFECYKKELDHLLNDSDESRYKYCVLALVVMFNNKLSEDYFSANYSKVIDSTCDGCRLNRGTSYKCLEDALHTLEGTYIVKDGDCYKTVHDKVFDFFSYYFGDKMLQCIIDNATNKFINERILWNSPDNTESNIEFTINLPDKYLDMFISRLVNDWSDGKVYELFCSRNLKSPTFIVKLLDHIKQQDKTFQVKLANVTVDTKYNNTTLLQSCFVGDINLTQWILDKTYYNSRCSVLCKSVLCCNNLSQWCYRNSIVNQCNNNGVSPVFIACQEGHVNILNTLIQCKADINKCENNDGTSPVYIACQEGHVNILNTLIQCKADINKCDNDGTSPVYIACQEGHVNILNTLIQCKADINKCDNDGTSPVYIACQEGHINILNTLIQCKADINKCNNNGVSPVFIACQKGHVNILNTLIQCKADINKCENNGASPVYIACEIGHINILNTLIQCKADINKCNNDGTSPVYIACQNGHVNILNTLIQCKADINKCMNVGTSPVYIACKKGHVNILNTLIQCKADINKCTNDGISPVYTACYKGHVNILNTLIQCKADINKCMNDDASPVFIACQNGHVNILNTLIQCKADINKCTNDGVSPVYIACEIGHINILNTLIQCKADINKCINDGTSPVYIACQKGHVNILNTLIQYKADINKCKKGGHSPLHVACYCNHIDVVIVLLKLYEENNVQIDLCNDLGNTPLHRACYKGYVQIVKLLLQHGANPHQCNNEGKSPLQVADDNCHVDVVTAIKQFKPF